MPRTKKQRENNARQARESKKNEGKKNDNTKKNRGNRYDNSNKSGKGFMLDASSPCPVHPDSSHTWGKCYRNPANANNNRDNRNNQNDRSNRDNNKKRKNESHAASVTGFVNDSDSDNDKSTKDETMSPASSKSQKPSCSCSSAPNKSHSLPLDLFQIDVNASTADEISTLTAEDLVSLFTAQNGISNDGVEISSPSATEKTENKQPSTVISIKQIEKQTMTRHLRVLFDTGSSASFISRKVLPKGVIPRPIRNVITTTISGSQNLQGIVTLRGIMLPEFTTSRRISTPINALVFDNDACSVDLIFGTDVLIPLGIDVHNSRQEVRWMDKTIPLYSQPKKNTVRPRFST